MKIENLVKVKSRQEALAKVWNARHLTFNEIVIFKIGFNMGWKAHKKKRFMRIKNDSTTK